MLVGRFRRICVEEIEKKRLKEREKRKSGTTTIDEVKVGDQKSWDEKKAKEKQGPQGPQGQQGRQYVSILKSQAATTVQYQIAVASPTDSDHAQGYYFLGEEESLQYCNHIQLVG